jgi:hypothetical protein
MRDYRAERLAETKNVKAALIAAGFKGVSVKHDRGTAAGWLDVKIEGTGTTQMRQQITEIAIKASGREGRPAEQICVNFMGAY